MKGVVVGGLVGGMVWSGAWYGRGSGAWYGRGYGQGYGQGYDTVRGMVCIIQRGGQGGLPLVCMKCSIYFCNIDEINIFRNI